MEEVLYPAARECTSLDLDRRLERLEDHRAKSLDRPA
jgi:hypothetical protein